MGVILQVALPSRVLAAARLQCGAAGAGASRGLGVCAEHARLAARGESPRAMEIGEFLGRLRPGGNSQCGGVRGLRVRRPRPHATATPRTEAPKLQRPRSKVPRARLPCADKRAFTIYYTHYTLQTLLVITSVYF